MARGRPRTDTVRVACSLPRPIYNHLCQLADEQYTQPGTMAGILLKAGVKEMYDESHREEDR